MADTAPRPKFHLRSGEHRILLILGDLVASVASDFAAIYTWRFYLYYKLLAEHLNIRPERAWILVGVSVKVPLWFYLLPLGWLLLMVELYDPHVAASWRRTLRGIEIAAFVGLVVYSLIFIVTSTDTTSLPRIGFGAFLVTASLLTLGWRALYIRLYTSPELMRRVLIVGAGKAGLALAQTFNRLKPPPFNLIGFIDDDPRKVTHRFEGFPVIGSSRHLLQVLDEYQISDIAVAITGEIRGTTFQAILDAQERGVEVTRMPILYEEMAGRVPVHHLESDWMLRSFTDEMRVSRFYEAVKRLMDLLGGAIGLLLCGISFPFVLAATWIDSGFPIFYAQTRVGRGGQVFKIYKFRTMHQGAEADGEARLALENDPRVTRVGNFLRKARLDELPQFWNVLSGEMSLVGPRAERPELVAEFQRQIPFYRARLLVKPGLTGWAQINYGYVANVTETVVKLEYDLYYIKHRSLVLDILIVLRTVGTVLSRKGR
ncbi:MAG TPA: sugar transferase [Anaerolineales bacterium]|nr:sugar transferase [Anaerolineales bacterium]